MGQQEARDLDHLKAPVLKAGGAERRLCWLALDLLLADVHRVHHAGRRTTIRRGRGRQATASDLTTAGAANLAVREERHPHDARRTSRKRLARCPRLGVLLAQACADLP